jgi:hypothetical protein
MVFGLPRRRPELPLLVACVPLISKGLMNYDGAWMLPALISWAVGAFTISRLYDG